MAMKWIDIPPVWLFCALGVTYFLAEFGPVWMTFPDPIFDIIGAVILVVGLLLIFLAAAQMYRHNTTVIPHLDAAHLVKTGIFSISRNPIYLGDVLVLIGCILRWDVAVALPLIPLLIWILQVRFIQPEESRLLTGFGTEFENYMRTVRRWI
jgi:protein-S-isoprenylcysteine O-methyltransferase Ste14